MDKPFAITLDVGSSLANKTGSWRTSRPLYVDRLPPCNHACPAGENIQSWLYHAEAGDYELVPLVVVAAVIIGVPLAVLLTGVAIRLLGVHDRRSNTK